MRAAELNEDNVVIDVFMVNDLSFRPNLVADPDEVAGAGHIYDPATGAFSVPPAPPVEPLPPVVPAAVTRRQARQALLLRGLLDLVPAQIAAIPDATQRGLAQIEWEDSQVFERDRPLVIGIGAAIGLDAAALDELFIEAAGL